MKSSLLDNSLNGMIWTRRRRGGFTLIELLVTIAIIAILASLLFPALKSARDTSKGIVCLNNHRQLRFGMKYYQDDNDSWLPIFTCDTSIRIRYWPIILLAGGYLQSREASPFYFNLTCPSLPSHPANDYYLNIVGVNYKGAFYYKDGLGPGCANEGVQGSRDINFKQPSRTLLTACRYEYSEGLSDGSANHFENPSDVSRITDDGPSALVKMGAFTHRQGNNYSFSDGHGEWILAKKLTWDRFLVDPSDASYANYSANKLWNPCH